MSIRQVVQCWINCRLSEFANASRVRVYSVFLTNPRRLSLYLQLCFSPLHNDSRLHVRTGRCAVICTMDSLDTALLRFFCFFSIRPVVRVKVNLGLVFQKRATQTHTHTAERAPAKIRTPSSRTYRLRFNLKITVKITVEAILVPLSSIITNIGLHYY